MAGRMRELRRAATPRLKRLEHLVWLCVDSECRAPACSRERELRSARADRVVREFKILRAQIALAGSQEQV